MTVSKDDDCPRWHMHKQQPGVAEPPVTGHPHPVRTDVLHSCTYLPRERIVYAQHSVADELYTVNMPDASFVFLVSIFVTLSSTLPTIVHALPPSRNSRPYHKTDHTLRALGSRSASRPARPAGEAAARRGPAGAAARAGVGVGDTSLLVERSGGADGLARGGIDAEAQPAEQAVFDRVAEEDVLHEGVARGGLLGEDGVLRVGGQGLGVGRVGGSGLDAGDEVLVEEGLPDVADVGGVDEGAVGEGGGVGVHHDVDVRRAARVVAREEGVELRRAVGVGLLHAAEEGGVDVGRVAVAVAVGHHARVDARRVAVCDKRRWSAVCVRGMCAWGGDLRQISM